MLQRRSAAGAEKALQSMQLLCRKFDGEEAVLIYLHSVLPWHGFSLFSMVWCYLRPVRGCTSGGCDRAGGATICLGLLTFVLDLANSNRMVWGRSGSNRTPCCKKTGVRHWVLVLTRLDRVARDRGGRSEWQSLFSGQKLAK